MEQLNTDHYRPRRNWQTQSIKLHFSFKPEEAQSSAVSLQPHPSQPSLRVFSSFSRDNMKGFWSQKKQK